MSTASVVMREQAEQAERERQARELRTGAAGRQIAAAVRQPLTLSGRLSGLFLVVAAGLSIFALTSNAPTRSAISPAPKPSGWQANRTTCASSAAVRRSRRCWRCARCAWNTRRRATKRSPTPICSTYPIRIFTGHTQAIYEIAYSHDGKYLFSGGQDGVARLWDVQMGQLIREFAWPYGCHHWRGHLA